VIGFCFRWSRVATDALLVLLLAAAAAVNVFTAPPVARGLVTLVAMLLIPGALVVVRLTLADPLATVALTLGISIAIDICLSLAMVLLRWWHPALLAASFGGVAALILLQDGIWTWVVWKDDA
jgi:hypothetical protein